MASSRSASGAWSRANSRNRPSPTVSRRERAALPDAHDVGVEDRAPDVVELEVALEAGRRRQAGRVERLDLRSGARGRRPARARTASRPPSPSSSSWAWRPRAVAEDRVVADEPAEARLDEVVERVVERAGSSGGRGARQVGRQRSGSVKVGSWDDVGRRPAGDAGRRRSGGRDDRSRRPASQASLGERLARGSDDRVDVVGGDVVVGDGPDLTVGDIPPSARSARASASRKAAPVAIDLEQDEVGARRGPGPGGPGSGWAVPPGALDAVHVRPGPRRGAGRWRGRRRGDRSCRPGHRPARRDRPPRGRPTWRMPPPTSLRARRARPMNSRDADDAPTRPGSRGPCDRQNVTVSAGAARSRAVTPVGRWATTAFQNRAPSMWSGTPWRWAIAATSRT